MNKNKDQKTVDGFGDEWERFDQSALNLTEHHELFDKYFSIFPWSSLPDDSLVLIWVAAVVVGQKF